VSDKIQHFFLPSLLILNYLQLQQHSQYYTIREISSLYQFFFLFFFSPFPSNFYGFLVLYPLFFINLVFLMLFMALHLYMFFFLSSSCLNSLFWFSQLMAFFPPSHSFVTSVFCFSVWYCLIITPCSHNDDDNTFYSHVIKIIICESSQQCTRTATMPSRKMMKIKRSCVESLTPNL
jgi:hypothetical protein